MLGPTTHTQAQPYLAPPPPRFQQRAPPPPGADRRRSFRDHTPPLLCIHLNGALLQPQRTTTEGRTATNPLHLHLRDIPMVIQKSWFLIHSIVPLWDRCRAAPPHPRHCHDVSSDDLEIMVTDPHRHTLGNHRQPAPTPEPLGSPFCSPLKLMWIILVNVVETDVLDT
jgi:hypothetical protein